MTMEQAHPGRIPASALPSVFEAITLDRLRVAILALAALLAPVCRIVWLGDKPVNVSVADVVLPLGLLFLGWRLLGRGIRLPSLGLCCAALFVMAASSWWNADLALAGRGATAVYVEFVKVLLLWLYFYLIVNVVDGRRDLILFLKCWSFSGAVVALLGIGGSLWYQATGAANQFALFYRAQGTFDDSNLFASHLVLSFFFTWALRRLNGGSWWTAAAMLVLAAGVLFSASRGGMLAMAASLALVWMLWSSWRTKVIAAFVGVAAGAVLSPLLSSQTLLESNPITARLVTTTVNLDNPEAQQRRNLWKIAIDEWVSSPVVGVGKGNYGTRRDTGAGTYAHSTYLGLLAEMGVAGFAVYGLVFGLPAMGLLRDWFGSASTTSLMLLAGLLGLLLAGVTISIENYRGLWIAVGLVEAYRRIEPSGREAAHVS